MRGAGILTPPPHSCQKNSAGSASSGSHKCAPANRFPTIGANMNTERKKDLVDHESVRNRRCQPAHDLQLDCGREGRNTWRTAGGSVRIFADSLWREPDAKRRSSHAQRSLLMNGGTGLAIPSSQQPARYHPRQRGASRGRKFEDEAGTRTCVPGSSSSVLDS